MKHYTVQFMVIEINYATNIFSVENQKKSTRFNKLSTSAGHKFKAKHYLSEVERYMLVDKGHFYNNIIFA